MGPRDAPIFVVGPARSGTTLVAAIIGGHSRIFTPGETPFFDDVYSRRRRRERGGRSAATTDHDVERLLSLYGRYGFAADQERVDRIFGAAEAREALVEADGPAALFERFMGLQAEQAGKPRWCCHVPRDAFNVNDIDACFPSARIVFCLRDPRDYLTSYRRQWRKRRGSENEARV
ncbi:MAG: sulfotransferase, partial [Thermoanaerobaculia bacterium]|nr:sulfotransferase [Thermoanaerobaculia bacterium]